MALNQNSVLVANLRGGVGDVVFSRNRSGNYVRPRTIPIFPNSTKQQQANNQVRAIVLRWQNLTDAARLRWMDAARSPSWEARNRLGRPYQPSGYQLFMGLNLSLAYFVLQVNEPPEPAVFPTCSMVSFETVNESPQANFICHFDDPAIGSDFRFLVHATGSMGAGKMRSKPQWFRWMGYYTAADAVGGLNFRWQWYNVYGWEPAPVRVFARVELVSLVTGERIQIGKMGNY